MNNTTIADCIISHIQRQPIINVYIRSTALYRSLCGNFRRWYYSAYMEEKRIKISRILDKNRESHYLLLVGTNKRQVYEENENKTAKRKYLW